MGTGLEVLGFGALGGGPGGLGWGEAWRFAQALFGAPPLSGSAGVCTGDFVLV